MVQPIDYTLDVLNPVQSTLQGFTGGMQLGTAMADRQRAVINNSAIDRLSMVVDIKVRK